MLPNHYVYFNQTSAEYAASKIYLHMRIKNFYFNLLAIVACTLLGLQANAQTYCNDFQGILNPTTTAQTVNSTGGYYDFAATSGCTYVFSHCSMGGSYTGDTYLRIHDGTSTLYASNDDFCSLGSQVTWTATVTATLRISLGTCCGGAIGSPISCSGGPTRVLAYWSTNCNPCAGVTAPVVPAVAAVCDSGSFVLTPTSSGTIHWFATSNTTGIPLATTTAFTTPIINSTTTYFAATFNAGSTCYSAATPVVCTVVPPPAVNLFSELTTFCNNESPVDLIAQPAGGVLTGTGAVAGQFDPAVAGAGMHLINYMVTDTNGCVNSDSLTMTVEAPVTDPTVMTCPGTPFQLTGLNANSVWFDAPTTNTPLDTGMTVTIDPITANTDFFYGNLQPLKQFSIDTIVDTVTIISDHNAFSGDDRGGIAVTPTHVYYVGDNTTARANAADLTGWVALPQRDGIFSDLQTGQLYTLWDSAGATDPQGTFTGSFEFSSIAPMNADLDIDTANAIHLSQVISAGNGADCGIFAGYGILIFWNALDLKYYKVELVSGTVSELGIGSLSANASENWAIWGVAEYIGDDYFVTYRAQGGNDIDRYDITNASTSTLKSFPNSINDLACFTFSPWNNNWYFHHEGSSTQFGGGSENVGFVASGFIFNPDAITLGCRTIVPVELLPVPNPNLGPDISVCSNENFELDPGTFSSYLWTTGETTQTISVDFTGIYGCTVSNAEGCTSYVEVMVTVNDIVDVDLGGDQTICDNQLFTLNAGNGYAAYEWNDMTTDPTLVVNGSTVGVGTHVFYVTATTDQGCTTTDTVTFTIDNCTGIDEKGGAALTVFPNPSNGLVYVDFGAAISEEVDLTVLDVSGKAVFNQVIGTTNQSRVELNLSDFPVGLYYINLVSAEATSTHKITLTK